ncbi:MAG TPA: hypothetical protein VGM10_24325 [Actinocrinis sp.]|jgi:hypothetical protein
MPRRHHRDHRCRAWFAGPGDATKAPGPGPGPGPAKLAAPRRTTAALAALGALGALTLSGCSATQQPNAALPKSSPTAHASKDPSPSPSSSSTGPTFDIPADLHVVIDPDTTSDATQNAVLTDAGYQWMSYMEAISQGNAGDPNFTTWTSGAAYATMSQTVSSWKSKGQRPTGTDHLFNRTVKLNTAGTIATYEACEDASATKPLTISSNAAGQNTSGSNNYVLWLDNFQSLPNGTWLLVNVVTSMADPLCETG